jgi:peptide/nickel transport system substrate-binding protein
MFPALEKLSKKAAVSTSAAQRTSLFHAIGTDIDTKGPFFPLLQPGQVVASSKNLTNAPFNVLYWLDVAAVGSH